jgi:hypothetical protein
VVENKREQFVHRPSLGFVVKLEPLGVMNNIVTAKLSFHGEAGLKEAPVKAKDLVIVYTMLLNHQACSIGFFRSCFHNHSLWRMW